MPGEPVTMDVGGVVFVNEMNYNGTPTNADDDVTISTSVESVSGPHPTCKVTARCFVRSWLPRSPRGPCRTSYPRDLLPPSVLLLPSFPAAAGFSPQRPLTASSGQAQRHDAMILPFSCSASVGPDGRRTTVPT